MGSFYADLAKAATEGIEKIGAKVSSKLASSSTFSSFAPKVTQFAEDFSNGVERGLYHGIFKPERAFDFTPSSKLLGETYYGPYKQTVEKLTSEGVQRAKATGSNIDPNEITKAAKMQASSAVFGQNRSGIQAVLKDVERKAGKNKADILADNLNVLFQEAPLQQGIRKGQSQFDIDMAKSGKGIGEEGFNTPATKYRPPNNIERNLNKFKSTLAYKAAIPHAVTNLNILTSDGFRAYFHTLDEVFNPATRKGAESQLLASNAISEAWMAPYREKAAFDNGFISKFAPGSVGEFVHKNMYIPGMSAVRYQHLVMGAQAGKFVAQEAAGHLANGDTKWALPALRELGLDAAKLKSQNFQLASEDIEKAFYHGADHRVFLDNNKQTPLFWRRSPLFRSMHAFTGYISNQWAFERATMTRQWQQGDAIGIARNLALKATVYPIVGASIYEMERLLTGQDWDNPGQHLENRVEATPLGAAYDAISGKENSVKSAKVALNTIDMLSHLGVWGTTTGYIRGASRAKLAQQIGGPLTGVASQILEDTYKAIHTDTKHPHASDPLMRDLLTDFPSLGLGGNMAKKFYPTRAEQNKNKPHKIRITRKPKAESSNPLNADEAPY